MRESIPWYKSIESLFTSRQIVNGELACRSLSDKARRVYEETDPLRVAEYEIYEENSEEPTTLYAYKDGSGGYRGLTFEELQEEFESWYLEQEEQEEQEPEPELEM